MANRVLAAVRKFFNWCISRELIELSPCAGVGLPTRERARHRTLSDEELASVLKTARAIGHPFGGIVQMLALTAQRRDEVGRLTWDQFDLDRAIWAMPPEHAKNEAAPSPSQPAGTRATRSDTPHGPARVLGRRHSPIPGLLEG